MYSFTSSEVLLKPIQLYFDVDVEQYGDTGEVGLYKYNRSENVWSRIDGYFLKNKTLSISEYGTYGVFYNKNGRQIPMEYNLLQNYPNPFNPSTKIKFDLPEASRTTLTVFNVLGQKIKTVVNKRLEAGRHVYEWDGTSRYGSKVASGVYFYQLISGSKRLVKKMVFVK